MAYAKSLPTNKSALASFICGLAGWIINVLLIILYFATTLFTVVTLGLGGLLYCCLFPATCISPILWIVGIITGHMGLGRIGSTGEGGRGFGIAGLILSYIGVGLIICSVLLGVVFTLIGSAPAFMQNLRR